MFKQRYVDSKILQTKEPYKGLRDKDFRILNFQTIYASKGFESVLSQRELEEINTDEFYIHNFNKIYQNFTIELFEKKLELAFKIQLIYDTDFMVLKAIFEPEKNLVYYEDLEEDILQELYKQMIKENFLLLRFEKKLPSHIQFLVQRIKDGKELSKISLDIARGVEVIHGEKDELVFHKKPVIYKNQNLDDGKISHDEKTYSKTVDKDELLFEYIKVKRGRKGRNLKGYFVIPKEFFAEKKIEIDHKNIYKIEEKDKIQYFSASYGFLKEIKNNYFGVVSDLVVDSINLKNTGSVKSRLEEGIEIKVTNKNVLDEGIKSGVVVEAACVNVSGNIDAPIIKTENLSIKGRTHSKAKLYAKNAYVGTHKGLLEADIAFVDTLEGGTIKAKIAIVNSCMGGIIKADKIYIKNVESHSEIYPKEALYIDRVNGDMNIFDVNPNKNEEFGEHFFRYATLSKSLKNKLEHISTNMNHIYSFLVSNQVKVAQIKDQNLTEKKSAYKKIVEDYDKNLEKYAKLMQNYKDASLLSYMVNSFLDKTYKMVFKVNIIINNNKGKDNLVRFKILHPEEMDLRYILKSNDEYIKFSVKEDKNLMIFKEKFNNDNFDWINIKKEDYFKD